MDRDRQTTRQRTPAEQEADRAAILADLGFDEAAAEARARAQELRVRQIEARIARITADLRRLNDGFEQGDRII